MNPSKSENNVFPLATLEAGRTAVVRAIDGGTGFVQRMTAMGLVPGTRVTVIRSGGPVILEARGHRLVLGRGMVNRVMVQPEDG